MSLLTAHGLSKYYGAQDVFQNLELSIARDDKIALVGPNGVGKTTLLRILVGIEEPTAGTVKRARGLRIGYLPQNPSFHSETTLYDEMLTALAPLRQQERHLAELMQRLAAAPEDTQLMARYAKAQERFELAGGYDYPRRINTVLQGLGFSREMHHWPISLLSGGQITRALLARLLLEEPELLILDEPTNYLDLPALEWLESYLQAWAGALLVVSHDRRFLDRIATRVWELDHGRLETYRGNYQRYVQQKREREARRWREYQAQQKEIARTEAFIQRYKAGQRSKEAKGREKRLNRLQRIEPPRRQRTMHLRLETGLRSGDQVLISETGLTVGYRSQPSGDGANEHVLFVSEPFLVQRGDRVALIGPNGCGKTTFLRTIMGEVTPLAGDVRLGASVQIGYLPQAPDWLQPERSVLEHILDISDLKVGEARSFLGRFLFSGDAVFKQAGQLSGGEQARLGLALLTLRGANLLLLDEPTTHLDVSAQEVLQSVLEAFPGTILLVSHDRYLIDALATHVWQIRDGKLITFEGNYSELVASQQQTEKPQGKDRLRSATPRRQEREYKCRARLRQQEALESLEQEIERLEAELAQTEQLLALASTAQDVERITELARITSLQARAQSPLCWPR